MTDYNGQGSSDAVRTLRDVLEVLAAIGFNDPESAADPTKAVRALGQSYLEAMGLLEKLRQIMQPHTAMADCPLTETAEGLVDGAEKIKSATKYCQEIIGDGVTGHHQYVRNTAARVLAILDGPRCVPASGEKASR